MAHTNFTKSVPYNTIRLAQDVALWSSYERTHLDVQPSGSSYTPDWLSLPNMQNVSLGDMQRASDADIDIDGGRVSTGPLTPRWGVALESDSVANNGQYDQQIAGQGGNNNFVTSRNWNRASNPQNIRLSRFAQWDYTAVVNPADMDLMKFYGGGSSIWLQTARYGYELFQDQPLFVTGVKQNGNNSTRRPLIFRTNPFGDKFSTYPANNFAVGTHASDMNDILSVVSMGDIVGTGFGTAQAAYATLGRRTSSTGNLKIQAYTVTLNNNGSMSTATLGSSASATTGASSNYANSGACRTGNIIAVVGGRGSGGFYLNRLVFNNSNNTWSSTSTTLDSSASYGATRGDVVSAELNFGNTNKWVCAVWTETKSTLNRYCRMQIYNLNTNVTTTVGSEATPFDVSNSLKSARAVTLATTSNYWYILVGVSDSTGNLRLRVMRYNYGGGTWTGLDDITFSYGDTSLDNLFTLTNLTATEKTTYTTSGPGEDFVPGGTNDFERRLYFAACCATNSETDDVDIEYYYFDIDNNRITKVQGGTLCQGRNIGLVKSQYHGAGAGGTNQGQRYYSSYIPARNGAGNIWMPIIGGHYVGSSDKRLSISAIGVDAKPNWYTNQTGDPGSNIFSTIGTQYTSTTNIEEGATEATWNSLGRWKVISPPPYYSDNVLPSKEGYSYQSSVRNEFGLSYGDVSQYTQVLTFNDLDADKLAWADFFDTVQTYNQGGNRVYVRVSTNNSSTSAVFEIPAQTGTLQYVFRPTGAPNISGYGPWLAIDWRGVANSHSGNSWAFTYQGDESTYIGVEFSQSPFA